MPPLCVSKYVSILGYCSTLVKTHASQAVGTGTGEAAPVVEVPAGAPREHGWPGRGSRQWRLALLRRLLACADVAAALLASISLVFTGDSDVGQLAWSLAYLPVWVVAAKLFGLYDRDSRVLRHLTLDEAPQLVLWALVGTLGLTLFLELTPPGRPELSSAVAAGLVAAISAFVLRGFVRWLWRNVTPPERVAIIGELSAAKAVKRKLELFPDTHMTIVSEQDVIDAGNVGRDRASLIAIDRIVFAPASFDEHVFEAVLETARASGVSLSFVPPSRSAFGTAVHLDHLSELPVLEYSTDDLSRSTLLLKRVLDVSLSAVALMLLALPMVAVAIAIKLDSRGPVLFQQWRSGQDGKPFHMLKFRTMVVDAEALLLDLVCFDELPEPMFKLSKDPRTTRVGRFLRRWSIDELPQLLNVLKGEMSLVGPRPEQVDLVERYSPEQRRRIEVKPGITGPMQVNGRGALSLDERLALEFDYIENLSIGRDLRILGMTVSAVFRGDGAF